MGYDVNSYAESKVPFGNDFVTDLTFNQVDWNDSEPPNPLGKRIWLLVSRLVLLQYQIIGCANGCHLHGNLGRTESDGYWQPYSARLT